MPCDAWYALVTTMSSDKARIQSNLSRIRENISAACVRARRSPQNVRLIGVTKTTDLAGIQAAIELGVTDLGEGRVQQLCERFAELRDLAPQTNVRWHMIGHLQRNKVKDVLRCATMIHSVDSLRLAEDINARAERDGRKVDVMLEINCSNESQKFGVAVGAALHLGELISTLKHVRLVGLMTMAAIAEDPEQARPTFVRLRELFEEMRHDGIGGEPFEHLSMGMSQDYVVAVEEGATMLRIGSALFE